MQQTKTIIIRAGPTGLSAAYHLNRDSIVFNERWIAAQKILEYNSQIEHISGNSDLFGEVKELKSRLFS